MGLVELPTATIFVFDTALGPMGTIEANDEVLAVRVGYSSVPELRAALEAIHPDAYEGKSSELVQKLKAYAAGKKVSFDDVRLAEDALTPFARKVITACRAIPRGETISYARLAERAGSPNAYRAAGSVMSKNLWAVVVPCHRVVASGGGVGGYSVPEGLSFKRRLLKLEGVPG